VNEPNVYGDAVMHFFDEAKAAQDELTARKHADLLAGVPKTKKNKKPVGAVICDDDDDDSDED